MNRSSEPAILARHEGSLSGTLLARRLHSDALGLHKPYYVYEPAGLDDLEAVPVLFLFRGHHREWVNYHEDDSRHQATAIEELDRLITEGVVPPILAVMPGLSSSNNHVPTLGIDMVMPEHCEHPGLGTGKYWTFLSEELLPRIETLYPQSRGGLRLSAGFSLGGYTVSLLTMQLPGYFQHAAIYDGLFMWACHQDPRPYPDGSYTDRVWWRHPIFEPSLGFPRDPEAMKRWNPTDMLVEASAERLKVLRKTTYWILGADADGNKGNRDRCVYLSNLLRDRNIPLGFKDPVLAPHAAHNWYWTDRFLIRFLKGVFA